MFFLFIHQACSIDSILMQRNSALRNQALAYLNELGTCLDAVYSSLLVEGDAVNYVAGGDKYLGRNVK